MRGTAAFRSPNRKAARPLPTQFQPFAAREATARSRRSANDPIADICLVSRDRAIHRSEMSDGERHEAHGDAPDGGAVLPVAPTTGEGQRVDIRKPKSNVIALALLLAGCEHIHYAVIKNGLPAVCNSAPPEPAGEVYRRWKEEYRNLNCKKLLEEKGGSPITNGKAK